MKKILILILILLNVGYTSSYATSREEQNNLTIISREQWGANEEYTYINSSYWKEILKKRKNTPITPISEKERKKREEDYKKKIQFINENFVKENTITEKIEYEGKEKLAWKIQKSDYVNAIIVHHTHTEYKDSFSGIQSIYKFHSLNREWGDIGYNYVIGYDGEIFEGKKGGDYSVGAHSKWNNISTVGISIMGNYEKKGINSLQYTSLEKLIQHLSVKYGIDLSKKYYYNMDCAGAACRVFPLETHLKKVLSGHRDTGHTSCPGDKLYKQIEEIRLKNLKFTHGFKPVKRGQKTPYKLQQQKNTHGKIISFLKKIKKSKIQKIIYLVEKKLETEKNKDTIKKFKIIQIIAKSVLKS